jgi:chromosome segregation ATPase
MAAPQPPVPNAANLQAAVNGMTAEGNTIAQSVQAYNTHQQALNTELSLCANYNVAQIQQQLTAMEANIDAIQTNTAAIQASVATIQGNVATIQADVATVQANVATIQTSVSIIDAK